MPDDVAAIAARRLRELLDDAAALRELPSSDARTPEEVKAWKVAVETNLVRGFGNEHPYVKELRKIWEAIISPAVPVPMPSNRRWNVGGD